MVQIVPFSQVYESVMICGLVKIGPKQGDGGLRWAAHATRLRRRFFFHITQPAQKMPKAARPMGAAAK